jgi:hypothetical protein
VHGIATLAVTGNLAGAFKTPANDASVEALARRALALLYPRENNPHPGKRP